MQERHPMIEPAADAALAVASRPPLPTRSPEEVAAAQAAAKSGGATVHGIRGKLELDESGAVAGCSHIYAPKGKAAEYAELACNPYRGCGFGCAYCYVPRLPAWDKTKGGLDAARREFNAGAKPRRSFTLRGLEREAAKYHALGIRAQVLLSFTSDPFNPSDQSLTWPTIETLKHYGLAFCTLTKGGTAALPYLELFRPDRDAFATTLTSLDAGASRRWEPQAALPSDRLAALEAFHYRGIFTWVSLEPTLSPEEARLIVLATHPFVDHYKVGMANYLGPLTAAIDWQAYVASMAALFADLGVSHYFKQDLQQYLPAGYSNPLRIPQHH